MAVTNKSIFIQLSSAGADTGPFNIYTDADGFSGPVIIGVTKADLLVGIPLEVPISATIVRIQSATIVCGNTIDLPITNATTSTSSSSTSSSTTLSTTTTTTTAAPTTTSSTTLPAFRAWHLTSPGRTSAAQACLDTNFNNIKYTIYQTGTYPANGSTFYNNSSLIAPPYNGGDLWYQVQEAFIDNPTSIRIGIFGTVDVITTC